MADRRHIENIVLGNTTAVGCLTLTRNPTIFYSQSQMPQMSNFENLKRPRTTAILKVVISPYISELVSDFDARYAF